MDEIKKISDRIEEIRKEQKKLSKEARGLLEKIDNINAETYEKSIVGHYYTNYTNYIYVTGFDKPNNILKGIVLFPISCKGKYSHLSISENDNMRIGDVISQYKEVKKTEFINAWNNAKNYFDEFLK